MENEDFKLLYEIFVNRKLSTCLKSLRKFVKEIEKSFVIWDITCIKRDNLWIITIYYMKG